MSKGLEALERLYCAGRLDLHYVQSEKHKEDYDTIEKELKMLEIIKDKISVIQMMSFSEVVYFLHSSEPLTQSEYDLLKEVLL